MLSPEQNSLNTYILVSGDENRLIFYQIYQCWRKYLDYGHLDYELNVTIQDYYSISSNIAVKTFCYMENTSLNARYTYTDTCIHIYT